MKSSRQIFFDRFPAFLCIGLAIITVTAVAARPVYGQAFGVEVHNTLMPASGGMGGVGIARPQDPLSALNGNPASLTQYRGTQFGVSGTWIEPTYRVSHTPPAIGALPGLDQFNAKSRGQGTALGDLGVIQDFSALGMPVTAGMGLLAASGAGLNLRHIDESNGSTALLTGLEITAGAGAQVTDRLSVGANIMLGSFTLDGPFVGLTGASTDYALRAALGLNYDITCDTTFGIYYQTTQDFRFDDAIRLQLTDGPGGGTFGTVQSLDVGMPDNLGIGFANSSLMDGDLLLAVDVLYKQWDNAAFFSTLYDNQWVAQFGAQYTVTPRTRFRLGYVYAEDAMATAPGGSAGGITPPGGVTAINYAQALFGNFNRHRITCGVGIQDLLPGINLDLMAGGMFHDSATMGASAASLESYWVGTGITWVFDRGDCRAGPWTSR